ncbi:MAG: sensor histidine kinase [Planctomycetia bacterium]|nr:sensor histidine kinase [Planctomycetia bacterium]
MPEPETPPETPSRPGAGHGDDTRALRETERAFRAERQALRQLLRTQERERQLVSYEIHDGLAQFQAGAVMYLESCLHGLEALDDPRLADVTGACAEGLRLLRAAADEARRLIDGLRPPLLDELGIEEAVESLVQELRSVVTDVEFVHPHPLGHIDPDVATTAFRIVQESLSNVRKHARARRVRVALEPLAGDLALSVSDDGAGFDPEAVPEDRFGLEGIRQRARLFGREAAITTAPGRGTRIDVALPLGPAVTEGGPRG